MLHHQQRHQHLKVGMRQGLFHSETRHWIECQQLVQHVQQPDHVIMIGDCADEYNDEYHTRVEMNFREEKKLQQKMATKLPLKSAT